MVEFSLANFNIILDTTNLNYPGILVHVASDSHLGGILGHDGLQMTLEVTSDLKIELGDLNCLCVHASLACEGFLEMIDRTTTTGQLSFVDERARS